MVLEVVETEDAIADLAAHDIYLTESAGPDIALRFVDATVRAYVLLSSMPGVGAPRDYDEPKLRGMRVWPIPRFRRYLVFYRVTQTSLVIMRVLYGSQDIEALFKYPEE